MALNFPNVTLLGLSQDSRFFDAGFNFSNSKRLTINGLVLDLINSFGISGIWTGVDGILNTIQRNNNYDALVLNGINFGTGKIQSFSFSSGPDVRQKSYTAEIIVQETGNLFNFTGTYYTGINTTDWRYLDSFSEDYSFQKKSNGGYSYNHTLNIQFNSGVGNTNAIQSAKNLAKSLLTGSALGFAFYSGYTTKFGKRFYNESYNEITNACSFGENFEFDSDSGNYSVVRTNQFQLGENGIISVAESATIKGILRPTFESAASAISVELADAYGRCNNVFTSYAPAGAFPLIVSPTVQSRSFDIFENNVGYNITFSNDITNSGLYFWDYTQQVTYADGIARMTEDGSVQGQGADRNVAFVNARAGYAVVQSTAPARATDFYTNNVGPSFNFLESRQESYSPYQSNVRYTFNFSNEAVLAGTNGIKRIEPAIQETLPIYSYTKFAIFNYKEIVQDESNESAGTKSMSVHLVGERGVPLLVYLDNAKTQLNLEIPTGIDPVIIATEYQFNPNQNIADVNLTWQYNKVAIKSINAG